MLIKNKQNGKFVLIVIPQLSCLIKDFGNAAKKFNIVEFETFKQRAKAKLTKPCPSNSVRLLLALVPLLY